MTDFSLEMLRTLRLTGGIFLDAEFSAPWCISAQVTPDDCGPLTPLPRHIIAYHYIIAGHCFVSVDGMPPVEVQGGDIVVLPRNDHHILGSALDLSPVCPEQLIQQAPDGGLARIVYGEGGEVTSMLCGFLGHNMIRSAIIAMLPSLLKLNVAEGASATWIESSFRFAAGELAAGQRQSATMLAKLAELMFMEAVRQYIAAQPAEPGSWLAGMRDPLVGRALALLHGQLARRWTTDDLAKEVGLSRSAFAERFVRALGEPPMGYLLRHRLEQAANQLLETSDSIAQIAYGIGYESEGAFSRAFRREYSLPPATWRRGRKSR